jgi:hypothetical protein
MQPRVEQLANRPATLALRFYKLRGTLELGITCENNKGLPLRAANCALIHRPRRCTPWIEFIRYVPADCGLRPSSAVRMASAYPCSDAGASLLPSRLHADDRTVKSADPLDCRDETAETEASRAPRNEHRNTTSTKLRSTATTRSTQRGSAPETPTRNHPHDLDREPNSRRHWRCHEEV